jgi:tellurite resistance protein TehA-like permease
MGTAALATAAFRLPSDAGAVDVTGNVLGWALLGLSIVGLLVIVAANLLAPTPRQLLWKDLGSREKGPAYAAIPGAVLTVVLATEAGLPNLASLSVVAWILLFVTLIVAGADLLLTMVFFASAIANRGKLEQGALSGVWFMPQTVLLLSATTLARLSVEPSTAIAEVAAPLAVLFLGAGFLLFLLVGALVLGRLITEPMFQTSGIPSAWIMMSPAAASALAFIAIPLVTPTLLDAQSQTVTSVTSLMAGAMIGFSLWWLMVVTMLTIRLRQEAREFTPSSWGFVFPLAAVAVASGGLAQTWESFLMDILAIVMAALGTVVWCVVAYSTLRWLAARRG